MGGLRACLLMGLCLMPGLSGLQAQAETLQEALISAYNSNPRLMAERARVREADENYIQARSGGRLTSSVSGSLGYSVLRSPNTNFLGQPASGTNTLESEPSAVQLQVIQPLYQGGRIRALKGQAKASIMAAREGLRGAENSLFLSVATAYSDVARDEAAARIRRNNVLVLSRQLQAANDRFDVGEGTRTDIAQAETRLAASDIGLAQADAQLQVSRAAFVRLVGYPPEELQAIPAFALPPNLDAAMMIARENNPQLIASMLNEEAAKAAIAVAKSASKPTISLNGSVARVRGQLSNIPQAESGEITAQINIPIFAGGLNKSRVRAATQARSRFMFETRDTERAVDQAVSQVWAQLDAARRSLTASRVQVKSAEFAFEGVKLEQQVGTRSTLDVLNAEQELLNARLGVINAEAAVQTAEFQLLSTLGAFDSSALSLAVDSYDPADNFDRVTSGGMDKVIDDYVPIAVQKIGRQIPHIAGDVIGFSKDAILVTTLPDAARAVKDTAHNTAVTVKNAVDDVTRQTKKPSPPIIESPDN